VSGNGSVRTEVLMGTIVTIRVVPSGADAAVARAFEWFRYIEARCTRFNPQSELMQLTTQIGVPVPASAIVFEAVQFALKVADETGGAFDPTLGHYRDVRLDTERKTITLLRPLPLDLGAVAKGLAVDAAARELQPFTDFAIDAGGDLYLGGRNPKGAPWSVGIRHPRHEDELIDSLQVTNKAVCTSGDYERGEHILDPRTGAASHAVASATVVAPNTVLADTLATAVFVLGPIDGIRLLDRLGVDGLIVTPALERYETRGLRDA
jgi:thiamine biosynthesis lipoprotein